ncbi:MAG: hypothetical protein ACRD4O_10630, partial [Bryobacteraceae bacterium]
MQATGVRVNLPPDSTPACNPASSPAVCGYQPMLNQLDGFSVNPRIMACFSGPVNPNTLASGIFIVPMESDEPGPPPGPRSNRRRPGPPGKPGPPGSQIAIDRVIFDPASNCAFAKPAQVLRQQSKYLLVVTSAVQDSSGAPVAASPQFGACLTASDEYCEALAS